MTFLRSRRHDPPPGPGVARLGFSKMLTEHQKSSNVAPKAICCPA
jgi:hypothetical protein